MGAVQLTCFEIRCDACNNPIEGDDCIRHFSSPDEGISEALDTHEWIFTRDRKLFCLGCEIKAPECSCADGESMNRCDGDQCLPGCPCERHEEIGPIPACEHCGDQSETRAAAQWHQYRHKHDHSPAT